MKVMKKSERIDAALAGRPVDRIPASFWRHFYQCEDTARGLSDAMINFQENYDWDFIKVNPRASYHYEDWGGKYRFFKDGFSKPQRIDYPVKKIGDFNKIMPLKPLKTKVLREHIDSLHYIKKTISKDVYIVMTIFTPLSIVGYMTKTRDHLKDYMAEDPQLVKNALEAVTKTFESFIMEILNVGISGLFYATTYWGTYNRLNDKEFNEFSRPYDLRLLNLVQGCPLNILHVCKGKNMLKSLRDYPVKAFNWDSEDPSNEDLGNGQKFLNKTVIGGIDHSNSLLADSSNLVISEANEALKKTKGLGWILGAGCTYNPETPSLNLKALREWVEKVPVN